MWMEWGEEKAELEGDGNRWWGESRLGKGFSGDSSIVNINTLSLLPGLYMSTQVHTDQHLAKKLV